MDKLFRLLDYFFFRWTQEFLREETDIATELKEDPDFTSSKKTTRRYYVYKCTNKFDGSVKIIRELI